MERNRHGRLGIFRGRLTVGIGWIPALLTLLAFLAPSLGTASNLELSALDCSARIGYTDIRNASFPCVARVSNQNGEQVLKWE